MPRGRVYSEEENRRLNCLIEDFAHYNNTELAELSLKYGVIEDRPVNGIAQHIQQLRKCDEQESAQSEQMEIILNEYSEDNEILITLRNERDRYKFKYESLLETILDHATLFDSNNGSHALKLDYRSILTWITHTEERKYFSRMEELILAKAERSDDND